MKMLLISSETQKNEKHLQTKSLYDKVMIFFLPSCITAHDDVTDTSTITREDYTVHDLHQKSRGKKSLKQ
jgi:hypothetical protein